MLTTSFINREKVYDKIREKIHLMETSGDLKELIENIGNAKYVLLGEASHGTHEFYLWRAIITKKLIAEKGFSFVGVEGDWPDCYEMNRYVKGYSDAGNSAYNLAKHFNRWPTWMWANWEVIEFIDWLRQYNEEKDPKTKAVGFYGLDVYSLGESLEAILEYLKKTDLLAFKKAKTAIQCFEPYGYEGTGYAKSVSLVPKTCRGEVVDLLKSIRENIKTYNTDPETVFSTEQNALIAVNAENYYRTMISGGSQSWNIRDRHMVNTLERLMSFHGPDAKAIVWEHNTHIGDARATSMSYEGMINVGELLTETYGEDEVKKIGFGTYKGNVVAGRNWGDVMRIMKVPKAVENSWEELLHGAGEGRDLYLFLDSWKKDPEMNYPFLHRAIGVVYHPSHEHYGNYVPSIMPFRYDAFIHIDDTQALHPIHLEPDGHQMPETYPWGI